jgi:FdhD protein
MPPDKPNRTSLEDYQEIRGTEDESAIAIRARALKARLDQGDSLKVIDIRQEPGGLPGAASVPLARLISAQEGLDPARETVLVCQRGDISEVVVTELKEQGYGGRLLSLTGGLEAWNREVAGSGEKAPAPPQPGARMYPALKVAGGEVRPGEELVIEEAPLTIFLNGRELITVLASRGEENFLATGFLASEGIIKEAGDIKSMEIDTLAGLIQVETQAGEVRPEKLFLKRYLTACCGKGGGGFNFASDAAAARKVDGSVSVTLLDIMNYSQMLEDNSQLFKATGAAHGGALVEGGRLVFFSFDIGRHNVFDKIYGRCLMEGIPTRNKIMVFSGRVSSEILIKLSKMNIPIIIARSAPTSLALDLAEEQGITVIGFARGRRLNIYTHRQRVVLGRFCRHLFKSPLGGFMLEYAIIFLIMGLALSFLIVKFCFRKNAGCGCGSGSVCFENDMASNQLKNK